MQPVRGSSPETDTIAAAAAATPAPVNGGLVDGVLGDAPHTFNSKWLATGDFRQSTIFSSWFFLWKRKQKRPLIKTNFTFDKQLGRKIFELLFWYAHFQKTF